MPHAEPRHLLILGGTEEARRLAERASASLAPQLRITTSLAGRTLAVAALAGAVRRGGFGGAEGLADYLRAASVDLVVDATHPFATRISAAAQEACRSLGMPLLVLTRPSWAPQSGDHWHEVASASEAAVLLPNLGKRVFLTIGRSELAAFSGVTDAHFLVRLVDPPAESLPLASWELILGRGPFTVDDERLIMTRHAIEVLVAKGSGGTATEAKLAAARSLGIPVVLQRRPPRAAGACVERVEDAIAWIEARLQQTKEPAS